MTSNVLCAIVGLLIGFGLGLGVLNVLLRDKTKQDLKTDKGLQRKYGALGWGVALLGALAGWWLADYI